MPHSRRGRRRRSDRADPRVPMGFVDMLIARWHALRRGDVVAIFLLAAFMGLLVIAAVVKLPGFTRTGNLGFGPDWEMQQPGLWRAGLRQEASALPVRAPKAH